MFDPKQPNNSLLKLPSGFEYDQKAILKATNRANQAISKLNWLVRLVPNSDLLITPLLTKESVESNAIENINTTTIKVLQSEAVPSKSTPWPEKEVLHYRNALLTGRKKSNELNWISTNLLIEIQALLEPNKVWIRKIPVAIRKRDTVVYTPPQWEELLKSLLSNLEVFINNTDDDIDPLIKVSVIHYQFESIHPFKDWNGRIWRILMILYLLLTEALEYPVLFLSQYINTTRPTYYRLLNQTNRTNDYTDFILYILEWIRQQSLNTQEKIIAIKRLMEDTSNTIQNNSSYGYHKIVKMLFSYPYMSMKSFEQRLEVSKPTATKYVKFLEKKQIVRKIKVWRNVLIYIPKFIDLLS